MIKDCTNCQTGLYGDCEGDGCDMMWKPIERRKMVHDLKCWPKLYGPVSTGIKDFEVRKKDRPFKIGDYLIINEWDPETKRYTGRSCCRIIKYILDGGQFGIEKGFSVLGLKTFERRKMDVVFQIAISCIFLVIFTLIIKRRK